MENRMFTAHGELNSLRIEICLRGFMCNCRPRGAGVNSGRHLFDLDD